MKKTNKGFSMVELIIVIAIMAILAGALAPTLIKYINKSRLSTDIQTGQTIATSITAALAVENAYDVAQDSSGTVVYDTWLNAQGSAMQNEVKTAMGNTTPTGKSKKDVTGAAFSNPGTFYVNVNVGSSSLKVYYGGTAAGNEVYPNPGSLMTN